MTIKMKMLFFAILAAIFSVNVAWASVSDPCDLNPSYYRVLKIKLVDNAGIREKLKKLHVYAFPVINGAVNYSIIHDADYNKTLYPRFCVFKTKSGGGEKLSAKVLGYAPGNSPYRASASTWLYSYELIGKIGVVGRLDSPFPTVRYPLFRVQFSQRLTKGQLSGADIAFDDRASVREGYLELGNTRYNFRATKNTIEDGNTLITITINPPGSATR